LVAVGPLVYVALGATGKGTIGGFLAACVATLWAAFGVVISLAVILSQVTEASPVPELATILIMAVLVLIILLIAAYGYGKLSLLLKSPKTATREVTFL
jgi:chromate transport protein ChrA